VQQLCCRTINDNIKNRVNPSPAQPPLPLDEALSLWLEGVSVVAPRRLPLREAVGRILAQDVVAEADHPEHHVALRAGYAVASTETIGAS
jgi:molybdopterin biosynthesis enzyme